MSVVVVTGTGTEVGKTIATAAMAAEAARRGSVCVVKPVQTGVAPGESGDVHVVAHLAGVADIDELVRLGPPLAPDTAAARDGIDLPPVSDYVDVVAARAETFDCVFVEGAGGVLVRLDRQGGTIVDLAIGLRQRAIDTAVVVVTAAGLGTLNHTELTVGALRARGIEPAALVVGSWPSDPGLAEQCNLHDLPRVTGVPLRGMIPAGAGSMPPAEFIAQAATWLRR